MLFLCNGLQSHITEYWGIWEARHVIVFDLKQSTEEEHRQTRWSCKELSIFKTGPWNIDLQLVYWISVNQNRYEIQQMQWSCKSGSISHQSNIVKLYISEVGCKTLNPFYSQVICVRDPWHESIQFLKPQQYQFTIQQKLPFSDAGELGYQQMWNCCSLVANVDWSRWFRGGQYTWHDGHL